MPRPHAMGFLVLSYAGASLFHHVHNAELLAEYPNMPLWITRALVYGAWLATTLVGMLGYFLLRKGAQLAGLAILALYGAAGLYGLAHYALAPASAHSISMNLGIGLEAAAGFLLMSAAAVSMARSNP